MAITFFEEITFDKLQVYLADYFMIPALPILLGNDILPIRKEKIALLAFLHFSLKYILCLYA